MATSNPMVPTPTNHGMGHEEALYRGIALAQLRILKQQMQLGGLFIGNRKVRLDNGMEILCNVSGIHESIRVKVPAVVEGTTKVVYEATHGFAVHPRTDQYPYGANLLAKTGDVYQQLTATALFPLYDNDNGTMLVFNEDSEWSAKIATPDNYGILAWTSEYKTITWRGFPAIALGFSRETEVEGVTTVDVQTSYNTYYTPLAPYLYIDGHVMPVTGKVRGAGVSDVGKVLVATVNYTQYDFGGAGDNTINPDGQDWLYDTGAIALPEAVRPGKVGGYYDELYVAVSTGVPYLVNGRVRYATGGVTNQVGESVNGWLRVGHTVSPVSNRCVWFASNGQAARCEEGEWSWGYQPVTMVDNKYPEVTLPDGTKARPQGVFTSTFTATTDLSSHQKIVTPGTGTSGYKRTCETSWIVGKMLTKHGLFSINNTDYSTLSDIPDESTFEDVVVKMELRPTPTDQYIGKVLNIDIDSGIFRFVLTFYNYKSGPFTWTTSQGSFVGDVTGSNITLDAWDTCGMITITVTDLCGVTASINVRGRTGAYVNILYTPMLECLGGLDPCGSSITPYQYCNFNEMQAIAWANGDATYTWSCYFAPPDPAWLMWCHSGTAPDVPAGTELCRVTGEWQC